MHDGRLGGPGQYYTARGRRRRGVQCCKERVPIGKRVRVVRRVDPELNVGREGSGVTEIRKKRQSRRPEGFWTQRDGPSRRTRGNRWV